MLAEIPSGGVDVQTVDRGPEIELGSGRVAVEATVTMTAQMDREDSASRLAVVMDRAGAAQTWARASRGREVQQFQYLLDGDLVAEELQIDSWHGSPGSMGQRGRWTSA